MYRTLAILLASLAILGCNRPADLHQKKSAGSEPSLEGSLIIAGAYALAPLMRTCADSFMISHPGAKINILATGHERAMALLETDSVQMAMISRPLIDREEKDLFAIAVAKSGVVLLFNSNNPYRDAILSHGLTIRDLQKVFVTDEQCFWDEFLVRGSKVPVRAYSRRDQSGAQEVLSDFLFISSQDFKGIAVTGEDIMIDAVRTDTLGLGFCNVNDAFDPGTKDRLTGLEFLPVDLNMNGSIEEREQICNRLDEFQSSICNNTYPIKLSRNLYLVSTTKPTNPLTLAFIDWVLTEGQQQIIPLGYSRIPESMLKYNRYLLK